MNWFGLWRMFFLSLFPVVLLLAWAVFTGHLIFNEPSRERHPVRGIDVSHHNGPIEWRDVAETGIAFAFIKATEGSDFRDPLFQQNFNSARSHGINVGAYHFFSTLSLGEEQAQNFIDTVPRRHGMLPPVIDVEFQRSRSAMTDEKFHHEFAILFSELQSHYGVTPIVYTTREFHEDYLAETRIARLWARALVWKVYPLAEDWTFWQYSNRGRIEGIPTPVDLNVFRGSTTEFSTLLLKNKTNPSTVQLHQHSPGSPP